MPMEVSYFPLGPVQANCYIIKEQGHVLVIDPGSSFDYSMLDGFEVDGILLTHSHFDHIGGVDALVDQCGCKVYIHESEVNYLIDPNLNCSSDFYMQVSQNTPCIPLKEGTVQIGNFTIDVIHCPGHSKGSCVFKIENCLFTGDVLFKQSIGRTDLYGGSYREMMSSLIKLKNLEGNYHVLPGHGPLSTLEFEKKYNSNL